jgi:hypothetical protein
MVEVGGRMRYRRMMVGCILIQISVPLSDMSDDLPPHSNIVIKLYLCLYMSYEIDVDDDTTYISQVD